MAVFYDIAPELNLLIYVVTDKLTGVGFFEAAAQVDQDERYTSDMKIIIDISDAEIETSVSDLHLAVKKNKELKSKEKKLGQTAVYTHSSSLIFLAEALRVLSPDAPTNFNIFNNEKEAVQWLGFEKTELQVLQWWGKVRTQPEAPVP